MFLIEMFMMWTLRRRAGLSFSNPAQPGDVGWLEGVVTTHVLYGLRADRGEVAARVLARRLGHEFERRESHWMGEYWLARIGSSTVKIVSQPDAYGDPVEDSFADYGTLVYVDGDDVVDLDGTAVVSDVLERLRSR
jgi:hypothetical protein